MVAAHYRQIKRIKEQATRIKLGGIGAGPAMTTCKDCRYDAFNKVKFGGIGRGVKSFFNPESIINRFSRSSSSLLVSRLPLHPHPP